MPTLKNKKPISKSNKKINTKLDTTKTKAQKNNKKTAQKAILTLSQSLNKFIVPPGKKLSLVKDIPTEYRLNGISKSEIALEIQESIKKLAQFQDILYAQNNYGLLIIFQAMDAAGKDSTIKHVSSGLNPQACFVRSFKAPSAEELDHDYLWRAAKNMPRRGCIGIFNRSYYEEVLVVKVHPQFLDIQQLPKEAKGKDVWNRRYTEINNFEKYLVDNGIHILKFFLHISKDEQKRRFIERLDNPDKNWKFSISDAKERMQWNKYMKAYSECFENTSTKWAPWHIIPADYKPFARLAVSNIIHEKLQSLNLSYPKVGAEQKENLMLAKQALLSE